MGGAGSKPTNPLTLQTSGVSLDLVVKDFYCLALAASSVLSNFPNPHLKILYASASNLQNIGLKRPWLNGHAVSRDCPRVIALLIELSMKSTIDRFANDSRIRRIFSVGCRWAVAILAVGLLPNVNRRVSVNLLNWDRWAFGDYLKSGIIHCDWARGRGACDEYHIRLFENYSFSSAAQKYHTVLSGGRPSEILGSSIIPPPPFTVLGQLVY